MFRWSPFMIIKHISFYSSPLSFQVLIMHLTLLKPVLTALAVLLTEHSHFYLKDNMAGVVNCTKRPLRPVFGWPGRVLERRLACSGSVSPTWGWYGLVPDGKKHSVQHQVFIVEYVFGETVQFMRSINVNSSAQFGSAGVCVCVCVPMNEYYSLFLMRWSDD